MSAQTSHRQPPEVYRRRRITVLVILIALIALAWWGVSTLIGGGAEAAPPQDPAGTTSPAPTTSPDAEADADAAAQDGTQAQSASDTGSSPEPTDTEEPAATITDCSADAITVAVGTEPSIAPDRVTFDASVTNNGPAPCLFAGDGEDTSLQITSGDVRVWSSADCSGTAAVVGKRWVLESGKAESFQVSWPRSWSFEGCTEATGVPQPGAYWAALKVGGVDADRVQFVM